MILQSGTVALASGIATVTLTVAPVAVVVAYSGSPSTVIGTLVCSASGTTLTIKSYSAYNAVQTGDGNTVSWIAF